MEGGRKGGREGGGRGDGGREGGGKWNGGEKGEGEGGREGGEGRSKGELFTVVVVVFVESVDGSPISSPVGPRKQDSTTSSNSVLNVRKGRGLALPVSAVYTTYPHPPQTRQTKKQTLYLSFGFQKFNASIGVVV